mgnify:CR=1 FL=1
MASIQRHETPTNLFHLVQWCALGLVLFIGIVPLTCGSPTGTKVVAVGVVGLLSSPQLQKDSENIAAHNTTVLFIGPSSNSCLVITRLLLKDASLVTLAKAACLD